MKRPASTTPGRTVGVDDLLADDPFRFTRSDEALALVERRTRRTVERPYWHLLRSLLGVGESVDEKKARTIWRQVLVHRKILSTKVGRLIPLRAAAFDWLYLRDEQDRPIQPVVLSRFTLSLLMEAGRVDALTGLPRRAQFERALKREADRLPFLGGCVVFIDLDGFKRANDEFGHAAGDTTLRRFALVARAALRKGDLVGRMGGDEFALMLHGLTPAIARRVIKRLRTSFERDCSHEAVSFSFGLSALVAHELPATVLSRADAAMYRQKRRRKDRSSMVAVPSRQPATP